MEEVEAASSGVSRRTVVRTAAWAAPAVTVMAATPAYAASPGGNCDSQDVKGLWTYIRRPKNRRKKGFATYHFKFVNTGCDDIFNPTFIFPMSANVKKYSPRSKSLAQYGGSKFVYLGPVFPGQSIKLKVRAQSNTRKISKLKKLGKINATALSSAGTTPMQFRKFKVSK